MITPEQEQILREIEVQAEKNNWPIIGPERGKVLVDVVRQYNPKRVLELGALIGYSSALIAANLPEGGKVISIEIDPERVAASRETQRRLGLDDRCEVVQGDALEMIPKLEGPWDMLFLDAVKVDYINYLKAAEPSFAPGAVVVADNVKLFADEIAPYLDYVRSSDRYASTYHEVEDDAVEVSVFRPAPTTGSAGE
jgi:predicted O-methyltransferase YrrM